ncbi:HAF repeat-containing protein [Pseudobacteroides cellulosolvens]|uniref:Extracellular repeat protein, HAF family n=1 Tax=Pseudobacteroides cellulosolvens ATCC 35603 = DSM 2933 TaxID=398512 RepID=A0A0L6JLB5_9FIRM|nr:HAF repeat-containing protein [Pseudobacteroides cellulosolvens]KNY26564.1 extracellular repeat protein, HAF family [Pseudobacteroides cellulosolvens ATCC 35603 = DSM 2933]
MDDGAKIYFDTFSFTEVTSSVIDPLIITYENDGQTLNVSLGQEVHISFMNHPKFLCKLISGPDGKVLTQRGFSQTPLFKDDSGYTVYAEVWKYVATGQGETEIKIYTSYYNGEAARIYNFKIITGYFTPTVTPTNISTNTPIRTPNFLPNVVMKDLGSLGGKWAAALAINEKEQIVGYSTLPGESISHAFIWENGVMKDLGTLGGRGSQSKAYAINEKGQVVGWLDILGNSAWHAFIYENGVMKDLGTLGGTTSEAEDINDQGQVVGRSYVIGDERCYGFIWENGAMKNLGTLTVRNSYAYCINEKGDIIGDSDFGGFLWKNGVMYFSPDLLPIASDINNRGQMVGSKKGKAFICETQMTHYTPELLKNPSFSDNIKKWYLWTDTGGNASGQRDIMNFDSAPAGYRITCNSSGTRIYSIQFYTYGLNLEVGKTYKVSFKAKASKEFLIPSIVLMKENSPWTSYSASVTADVCNEWTEYSYIMQSNTTDPNGRITFFLGESMPQGTELYLDSVSVKPIE